MVSEREERNMFRMYEWITGRNRGASEDLWTELVFQEDAVVAFRDPFLDSLDSLEEAFGSAVAGGFEW